MPTPGIDCHIVIDGVGYIMADVVSGNQESQKEVGTEQLAPHFGDPTNALDPLSSDLTMVLPIGQNDFTDGLGNTDLEKTPKGYERGEGLIVTPQGTLINGPNPLTETFTGIQPSGQVEGNFTGGITNGVIHSYLVLSNTRGFYFNGTAWGDFTPSAAPVHAGFYAGKAILLYGDSGLAVYNGATATAGTFNGHRFFVLNGLPFIIYKDGRIYAAWISRPPAFNAAVESGAIVAQRNWEYAVSYFLSGSPTLETELSPVFAITKTANGQVRLTLPVRNYKGGPVYRRLWRTTDNGSTYYLIADYTTLGTNLTNYLDTADDAAITGLSQWGWAINNTGLVVLTRGTAIINMAFPDTDPLFLPEDATTPSTGAQVTNVQTFHDAQGNEAAIIGTTNGFFLWNGTSRFYQTLKLLPYNPLNCKYMAVNHGVVYISVAGTKVLVWSEDSESELRGPWVTQFKSIREIRLHTAGKYVFFAVTGTTKYDVNESVVLYAFDGKAFTWSYRSTSANPYSLVLGQLPGRDQFVWYEGNQGNLSFRYISLETNYTQYQTTGVLFRSATSDLNLPRVRKMVQGVMVRYLQLTPQTETVLYSAAHVGNASIQVDPVPLDWTVGDWICIKESDLSLAEYRKITSIVNDVDHATIYFSHPTNTNLCYEHVISTRVVKCAAIVKLRNVFTELLPIQDMEVGGPCDSADAFALIELPWPVYTFADGIDITYNSGTTMELQGWAMLTAINPAYNGLLDVDIRLQDYIKLPNSTFDNATAGQRQNNLKASYNKGYVIVQDPLNNQRTMRFQRLSFDFEEPKERHLQGLNMQATAHVRLIDRNAELLKQETVTLSGVTLNPQT